MSFLDHTMNVLFHARDIFLIRNGGLVTGELDMKHVHGKPEGQIPSHILVSSRLLSSPLLSFCSLSCCPHPLFFSSPHFVFLTSLSLISFPILIFPIYSALSSPSFPFSSPHFIFPPFLCSPLSSCIIVPNFGFSFMFFIFPLL